jgi:hypothetical protein
MQNDTVWKNECDGTKTDMFALQEREREREKSYERKLLGKGGGKRVKHVWERIFL